MIKNLVFDYGGVIVNIHSSQTRAAMRSVGIGPLKQLWYSKRLKRHINDFIDGLIPPDQVVQEVLGLCSPETTTARIYEILDNLCGELPASRLAQLKEFRKKYRVILLSNINQPLWESSKREIRAAGYEVSDCFDECYLSYEMQLAKPDARIYEQFIAQSGINPDETLYFDDRKNNVEAGARAGLHAVLVPTNFLEQVPEYSNLL